MGSRLAQAAGPLAGVSAACVCCTPAPRRIRPRQPWLRPDGRAPYRAAMVQSGRAVLHGRERDMLHVRSIRSTLQPESLSSSG